MIINSTDAFVLQVQTTVELLRASIVNPADQIRILSGLASLPSTNAPGQQSIADATNSVCRRAALASLALATADFQPSSSTEVEQLLVQIVPLFDAEIVNAADSGDIDTYTQMQQVRTAVVTDLRTRGTDLPAIVTVTVRSSRASLCLAWNLYADASREGDLVNRNPSTIHPAFMPTVFEALSS